MNKIFEILLIVLMLSLVIQPVSALEEGKDYKCIDMATKELLPPAIQPSSVDKSIEKVSLCSEGKVPTDITTDNVRETIKDDVIHSKNGSKESASCSDRCYDWAYSYQDVYSKGVFASLTQHDPEVDPINGIYSLASIGIGTPYANRVEEGWRKERGGSTRLYTVWWRYGSTQCYNSGCGWVQTSSYYYPGMTISGDGGARNYQIQNSGGNWWISWNGEWLGYYPANLWNYQFDQGSFVIYRGGVMSNRLYPVTTTDMGNGLWSSHSSAARIDYQQYMDQNGYWYNANTAKYATTPSLYSVTYTGSNSMKYGGPGSSGSSGSSITVTSPNGGENLVRGTTNAIQWSYTGSPGAYVKIELLKNGAVVGTISWSTQNNGYYSWKVPLTQTLGTDYKIRIRSISDINILDISDNNFEISGTTTSPSIRVISPNGGESWTRGTTKLITWTKTGSPGANVRIQLYKGSTLSRTISSGTPNDGSFSWPIPWTQAMGSDYKIKISSTTSSYNDWSNSNFRIY